MTVRMEGAEAHLEGDWTVSGVEENMESLILSMKLLETCGLKSLSIDCGEIDEADTSGLQLLSVLMLCARLRGIEPKLVNVTADIRRAIQEWCRNSLTDSCLRKS